MSFDTSNSSPASADANSRQPPHNRLSIAHLLLWTLGSAIILAFYRSLGRQSGEGAIENAMIAGYQVAYSLTLGAQVGGLFLWLARRMRQSGSFPTQPGHWLLVVEGLSAILAWKGAMVVMVLEERPQAFSPRLWAVAQLPNCVATFVAYTIAFTRLGEAGSRWKTAFGLLAAQYGTAVLLLVWIAAAASGVGGFFPYSLVGIHTSCLGLSSAVVVAFALAHDARTKARDYLHWTGGIALLSAVGLYMSLTYFGPWGMA